MNAINTVRDAASGPVETVRMSFGSGKTNTLAALTRLKAPPSAEVVQIQKDFADNLARLMQAKGMKQSDLAREVWGTAKDKRGYEVARNRDRISAYLAGAGIPETDNLNKIAAALGCTTEDLLLLGAEEMAARPLTRTKAHQVEINMASVAGRPGWMQISLNLVWTVADTQEFLALYDKVRQRQEIEREETEGDE
jgi:transcriptional regulator with XRE-family HTH domain